MTYLTNYLTENHPKAKIYFIVNDCLKDEITSTIREVCNHYGISVVELKNIAKARKKIKKISKTLLTNPQTCGIISM